MTTPVDPTLIEEIVGIARHATEHYARLDSQSQQTYVLHSAECLTEVGTPAPDCPYTAAQENGVLDNIGDWFAAENQPVIVDLDDETLDDAVLLTPRWVEIDEADRFAPGTRVKVKTDAVDTGDGYHGGEYVIEGYVDKDERDCALPYYTAEGVDGESLGTVIPHAALEQVKSAAEHAEAMKMPQPEAVMSAVAGALHHMFGDDDMEIHETSLLKRSPKAGESPEGEHSFTHGVEFVGKTGGGRRFAGTLRLTSLYEADF